jgi:hypothetical protein
MRVGTTLMAQRVIIAARGAVKSATDRSPATREVGMATVEVHQRLTSFYGRKNASCGGERVHSIAAPADEQLEIIYSRPETPYRIGLRIAIDANRDDEFARVVEANVGEPLDAFAHHIEFDADGVGWWGGEPANWHYRTPS